MRILNFTASVSILFLAISCNPTPANPPSDSSTETKGPDSGSSSFALKNDGSISIALAGPAIKSQLGVHQSALGTTVNISAPIFPKVLLLYAHEDGQYPMTQPDKQALVQSTSLTFSSLLADCKNNFTEYTDITIPADANTVLTQNQLITNYNQVAKCSYEKFTSKPYWIPQLVQDVDICGQVLGGSWRMIKASDIATLQTADYQQLADTLSVVQGTNNNWGAFYFSLVVYAYDTNNALKIVNLNPAQAHTLQDFPMGTNWLKHLESGLNGSPATLRCIEGL